MLIIGRDAGFKDSYDRFRLDWRTDKVSVDSNYIICVTFDELHRHMDLHFGLYTATDLTRFRTRGELRRSKLLI